LPRWWASFFESVCGPLFRRRTLSGGQPCNRCHLPVRCGVQHPVPALFPFYLAYSLVYVPTLSVSNTIAFAALKEGKDFGTVRAGGTVGWIMASWPFIFILGAHSTAVDVRAIFIVSAVISLLLAGFSLTLPHTPPQKGNGVDRWHGAARSAC
jgi:hypothetical protein